MLARHAIPHLDAALKDTPVVLVHGARQTGKSTLTQSLKGNTSRQYFTLDDATVLAAATNDPSGFIASFDGPVVLDEVQRAPGVFMAIKAEVDKNRKPGRFLLTGSANVLLLPKVSESLAGRIEIITLWPLSQGEIESHSEKFIDCAFSPRMPSASKGKTSKMTLLDRVLRGGYPEPLSRTTDVRRSAWFESYLTTILQRDIREMSHIEGVVDLPRLLMMIASRTSGVLNYADLSRSLSLPQTTLKRYFALLEATFLIVTLPAWASNQGIRLTKAPKVMLADTGLASHLLGMTLARLKSDSNALGSLVENFVVMELIKQATWSTVHVKPFHFRTVGGKEVDLVLENAAGQIVGIEVKASSTVNSDDFRGLRELRNIAGDRFVRGIVLNAGTEAVGFGVRAGASCGQQAREGRWRSCSSSTSSHCRRLQLSSGGSGAENEVGCRKMGSTWRPPTSSA